jgi:hypothetical protein
MAATLGSTFATTMRVVNWVHNGASNGGPNTHPASATSFADHDCVVFDVADLPHNCVASLVDQTNFAAWQS